MGQVQASWELVGPGTAVVHVFVCSRECVHVCVCACRYRRSACGGQKSMLVPSSITLHFID